MKEIVNNSKDSKFSDDSDMSPENISRPISSESEEDDCSEAESDIQGHMDNAGKRGLVLVEENE